MKTWLRLSSLLLLFLVSPTLDARVTRVEVLSRSDVLAGKAFGDAGAYERITGKVYFSVEAASEHNRWIVDLDKAENLKDGQVEFSADFIAIRPKDPHKGNGSLLLEVPNRGRSRILAIVDGGDWDLSKDAGDAWLLRNGFTFVSLGWHWDAVGADALKLYAPIAKDHGQTITGLLRGDIMPWKVLPEIPLGHFIAGSIGGSEYPVADANGLYELPALAARPGTTSTCSTGSAAGTYVVGRPSSLRTMFAPWAMALAL